MTPRRSFASRGVCVWTTIPASAGVVQDAGVPLRPSISTRQRRQEPNASILSVAHSRGIGTSRRAAAAMTDVPRGTRTVCPSMVSVTSAAPTRIGVPVSSSCSSAIGVLLFGRDARDGASEIFAEIVERAQHRQRREPAERAERTVGEGLAEVAQQCEIAGPIAAGDDLVDRLDAARRTDSARRATAAALFRAEGEGESRLARHVDAIVEHDDPAVAEHAPGGEHRLVIQRRIEQAVGEIRAQGPADLNRPDRSAGARSAAEILDEPADRRAEREFHETAAIDVARKLKRLRSARTPQAIFRIGLAAQGENPRGRGEAEHVVDDGGFAEQALDRGQRRLGAHLTALTLETLEQRGLLAADISAGA